MNFCRIGVLTVNGYRGVITSKVQGGDTAQRGRALLDLGLGYGLILAAIWTPNPWRETLCLLTLGWIVLSTWGSFTGWRSAGIRREGFLRSLWLIGVAMTLVGAALLLADRLHTLHAPGGAILLVESFWGYALWSFLQQFMLQALFLTRLLQLLSDKRLAVFAAASLFALAHLPNPLLTALTLVWGILSCMIFLRYRNLYTVGIVHAVLGICVAVTVPGTMQHDMQVGLGYLHYRPHGQEHRNGVEHVLSAGVRVSSVASGRRY
jgi:Type II CAAX prenyl endopeptidase Rce1-like